MEKKNQKNNQTSQECVQRAPKITKNKNRQKNTLNKKPKKRQITIGLRGGKSKLYNTK